jgi:hypothetical protein
VLPNAGNPVEFDLGGFKNVLAATFLPTKKGFSAVSGCFESDYFSAGLS